MGRVRSVCGWWLAVAMSCLLITGSLSAATVEDAPEVRVIIDVSGSMRVNDPEQLATEALELLVALIPGGARAGIWTFGERVANPLPPARVNQEWRQRMRALTPLLVDYQQFTDIESAIRQVAPLASDTNPVHLLLLTDGMIDLPAWRGGKPAIDQASRAALLDEYAPLLAEHDVVVHGIAFSDDADLALIERLAQLTGGLSASVAEADALLGAFLDMVDRIFPSDRAPVTDQRFVIEPGLRGFTALLFRGAEEPVLIAPDGERYSADALPEGVQWRREQHYDLVEVPDPQAGQWRLEGELVEKSRITLQAPLQLQISAVPSTLYLGFEVPVEAWLTREQEILDEDAQPAYLRLTAELRDAAGELQSTVVLRQQESRFVGQLPPPITSGELQFVVRAEGQGFRRQRVQAVNVVPPVLARHDEAGEQVILSTEHPQLDRHNTRLYGQLQGVTLAAEPQDEQRWHMPLPELDTGLSVPLMLRAEITLAGEARELVLPRLMLFSTVDTSLDQVDAVSALEVTRFHDEPLPQQQESQEPFDRLIERVQTLPETVQQRWGEGPAWLNPLKQALNDPRQGWPLLTAALLPLLLLLLLWRAWQRRRYAGEREEPHV